MSYEEKNIKKFIWSKQPEEDLVKKSNLWHKKENSNYVSQTQKETMRNKVYRYKDRNKNNWIIWVPREQKGTSRTKPTFTGINWRHFSELTKDLCRQSGWLTASLGKLHPYILVLPFSISSYSFFNLKRRNKATLPIIISVISYNARSIIMKLETKVRKL